MISTRVLCIEISTFNLTQQFHACVLGTTVYRYPKGGFLEPGRILRGTRDDQSIFTSTQWVDDSNVVHVNTPGLLFIVVYNLGFMYCMHTLF